MGDLVDSMELSILYFHIYICAGMCEFPFSEIMWALLCDGAEYLRISHSKINFNHGGYYDMEL